MSPTTTTTHPTTASRHPKLPALPPHTALAAARRPSWAQLLAPSQPKVRRALGCPRSPHRFPLALAAAAPHSATVRRPPALVAPQPRFALARDRRGNQKPSTPSCLCPLHDRRLALARREPAPPSPPPPPLFWSRGRGGRKAILPLGPCLSFFSFMNPFPFRSFSKRDLLLFPFKE